MSFSEFIQFTILGLATAGIYAVAASGLVVTYQTSGIFNFAHGAVGMVIAFVYWDLRVRHHVPAPIALAIALFVVAPLLGAVIERLLMRHLAGSSVVTRIVVTIGLLVGILGVARVIWSGNITPAPNLPRFFGDNVVRFGGVNLPWHQVIVLICAVLVAVGLRLLLKGTRLGIAMRAVVDDRELTGLNGCNPARTSMSAWMLGSFLAGLAGILIAPTLGNLDQSTLTLLVINAFAAAMVGRLRSLPMTFVGAVILGLTGAYMDLGAAHMATSPVWYSDVRGSLPAILLFIVLLVIPEERIRVSAATEKLGRIPRPSFRTGVAAAVALVVGVVVVGEALTGANLRALGVVVALAIVMLSYVPLTGYAGQISLAQLTFAGLGAFIAVVVVGPNGSLVGVPVAFVSAAAIGALVALPAVRLRGLYVALATMAFALVIENVVFAGDQAFSSDIRAFGRPSFLAGQHAYLFFMVSVFAVLGLGVLVVRRSTFGRRLQALKDSPAAAATIGMNQILLKLGVFALSAGIAGIGGYLLGCWKGQVGQSDFALINGALPGLAVLLLAVVGGIAVISGAFFGAVFLVAMPLIGDAIPALNNLMMILPGLVGVTLAQNPDGAVMQIKDRFQERFGARAGTEEDVGADVEGTSPGGSLPGSPKLSPEEYVLAGTSANAEALAALREGLGLPGSRVMSLLEVDNVTVRFGGNLALDEVGLAVESGMVTGLIGPNGAGKTTTFNVITGLQSANFGRVILDGDDITHARPYKRARAGIARTFQRLESFGSMTVRENVLVAAEVRREPDGEPPGMVADALLERLRLRDLADIRSDGLPTGRARVVEIARALATHPHVLLLDEPASGLSDSESDDLAALLSELASDGLAILLVEHDVPLVMRLCARIYVLDFGRILTSGTAAEVQGDRRVQEAYLGATEGGL